MANMKKSSNHGGRREGAGRPTKDGATDLKQVPVMLTPENIDKAKKLGKGNISLGIRRAMYFARYLD